MATALFGWGNQLLRANFSDCQSRRPGRDSRPYRNLKLPESPASLDSRRYRNALAKKCYLCIEPAPPLPV
jgi:hypothetical protein